MCTFVLETKDVLSFIKAMEAKPHIWTCTPPYRFRDLMWILSESSNCWSQTPTEHLTVHVSLEGCSHDGQWASNSAGITLADRPVSKLDDRTSQILMQSLVVLAMPASGYWSTEFWKSDTVRPPSPQVMIKLEWKAPESCTSLFTISSDNLLQFMLSFFGF